ncbi:hypothetical protein A2803_01750 [Candidatus Woesebacteria bacterium RIFCSPHIGHO2_01_FULL_44_21]|uniref:Single-stranded DNA-binding protein n=1 Tax=Candidatus Woesebacteria bacterium RIFCSPHIGHO2_01_FULL_44_21 TaxID=1802503 RepID=A0A1F7YVD8_9BACT|nr:MAG: hypothetical protein A2803_01750 [Candidatus Woesebacteria bacterium RIFCSPHIGHO2_01_FULL_44_21]OGM69597.1 MAG: hypothetical protein A2897_03265 [Candidatus Woesebacteria bacterium RIFCSPLOWO2_01_FULL_44_24b]
MARSLNKVTLIGNLTRDPELRYTPSGTAVTTFTIATNRQWKTESGDSKEDAEFHRVVAWDKLAEICAQFLKKGKQAYVEGRLQTRKWQTKEGEDKYTTEVVISEMILLGRFDDVPTQSVQDIPDDFDEEPKAKKEPKKPAKKETKEKNEESDDIPF